MPRNRRGGCAELLFYIFGRTPVWVGPLSAGAVYGLTRWLLPVLAGWPKDPAVRPLVEFVTGLAPVVAAVLAVLTTVIWMAAEMARYRDHRLPSVVRNGGLESLGWSEFERLVARCFEQQGYLAEVVGDPAGDGGIDIVLRDDDERVLVQCKHWIGRKVGVKPVRELFGVLCAEGADRAILVSSGDFTPQARAFADGKPLELVDRQGLMAMLRRTGDGS